MLYAYFPTNIRLFANHKVEGGTINALSLNGLKCCAVLLLVRSTANIMPMLRISFKKTYFWIDSTITIMGVRSYVVKNKWSRLHET